MFPHDKLDYSLSRLEKRLESAPDDAVARQQYCDSALSKALFHDGGEVWLNTALTQAKRIIQHDASNAGALTVAGYALVALDRVDAAMHFLDEAVRVAPEHAKVRLALAAMYRARDEHPQAIREAEMACRLQPESWEPHYLLGRLLNERASAQGDRLRPLERSQFHTVRALQLHPSSTLLPILIHDLGVSCLRTQRYDEALKLFTRLQEFENFRAKAYYYLGLVAFHLGKYKNSILYMRRHLKASPQNPHVYTRIGMAFLHLGEFVKAREACNKALAIEPSDLQARWTLASALLEEGHADEAVRGFKEVLEDAPDHIPAFTELVRIRSGLGDGGWLRKALRAEVGVHDRLPSRARRERASGRGTVEIDPRSSTRERIKVVLRALADQQDDTVSPILEAMDLTTEEGLRFQLWEAALSQLASQRARAILPMLKNPGRMFSAQSAREILTLSTFLPEAYLTRGLQVEEEHLQRAAVDRHGPAPDVRTHRSNVERERQEARAWQALLLLAIATRESRSGRNLLVRWASDADADILMAAQSALAMLGDTSAAHALRDRAARRGAEDLLDLLIAQVSPPEAHSPPRSVTEGTESGCSICGRPEAEVDHLMSGNEALICDRCVLDIIRDRRTLQTDDPAVTCALCGRTSLESRAVYVQQDVAACAHCIDHSLGFLEREEVNRYLSSW